MFRDEFRVESIRRKDYDYSSPGVYFMTICTNGFRKDFGVVLKDRLFFSESGEIVDMVWRNIPVQFSSVQIDEFVVMPDHIHGIIRIMPPIEKRTESQSEIQTTAIKNVQHSAEEKLKGGITGRYNPMLSDHSLSKIVRWFKGASSFYIHRRVDKTFSWHTRFYDRIIMNDQDLQFTRNYIRENPRNWLLDHSSNNSSR